MFVVTIDGIMTIIALVILTVFVAIIAFVSLAQSFKQWRCKHEKYGYRETMACDAVCNNCGKNLGFIGTIREQRK